MCSGLGRMESLKHQFVHYKLEPPGLPSSSSPISSSPGGSGHLLALGPTLTPGQLGSALQDRQSKNTWGPWW